jgi:hypothetical protein
MATAVIACDKRETFAQGSEATKQSILSAARWITSVRLRSMSYGGRVAALAMTVIQVDRLLTSRHR